MGNQQHLREPADRDRLFTVSILKYGRLAAMRESGESLRKLGVLARRAVAESLVARPPTHDEEEQFTRELILTAISELEAFDLIERVRRLRPIPRASRKSTNVRGQRP